MVFARFFKVFLRKYLTMKSLLLCLLLLPALSAVAVLSLQSPAATTGIRAGILAEVGTPYVLDTVALLTDRSDVTFSLYPDLDSLVNAVADGTIVAGYVLDENFDSQISSLQTDHLVQLIKLEDDIYHGYLNELVYSAIYTQLVPHITQEFLLERGIDTSLEELTQSTSNYLEGDALFTMEFRSVQAIQGGQTASSPLPLVRGILAVGLLTLVLFAASATAQTQRGWALFAPYLRRIQLDFYALSPIYLLGMLAGVASLLTVAALSSYPISWETELMRLALYLLMLLAIGLVLPRLIGRNAIVLLIPFLLLFVVVTHPIVFDVTSLFPSWKSWLSWLPSYWYMG